MNGPPLVAMRQGERAGRTLNGGTTQFFRAFGRSDTYTCPARKTESGDLGQIGWEFCGHADSDIDFAVQLRNQFGAKACELLIGDRSLFLEPIKLLDLVSSAETDDTPQIFARLLHLLAASFRHAPSLSDQVREYAKVGEHEQCYYPESL